MAPARIFKSCAGFIAGFAPAVLLAAGLAAAAIAANPLPALAQQDQAAPTPAETRAQQQSRPRARIRVEKRQPAAWPHPRPGAYSPPGPGAVRQCEAWYATEHRPSGTVVTPQQRCRWVRD